MVRKTRRTKKPYSRRGGASQNYPVLGHYKISDEDRSGEAAPTLFGKFLMRDPSNPGYYLDIGIMGYLDSSGMPVSPELNAAKNRSAKYANAEYDFFKYHEVDEVFPDNNGQLPPLQ